MINDSYYKIMHWILFRMFSILADHYTIMFQFD